MAQASVPTSSSFLAARTSVSSLMALRRTAAGELELNSSFISSVSRMSRAPGALPRSILNHRFSLSGKLLSPLLSLLIVATSLYCGCEDAATKQPKNTHNLPVNTTPVLNALWSSGGGGSF
ncbi:hypothetical protein E2C01_023543 [Portunus trituberculatus]|uniref:Uncharacterized protein n=1 Tax=Portunus trituberculatus TaxID=210409 RepID=A0A5B7E891_PORTR|nr:hypothetical protein [Portunus trituberculatus]